MNTKLNYKRITLTFLILVLIGLCFSKLFAIIENKIRSSLLEKTFSYLKLPTSQTQFHSLITKNSTTSSFNLDKNLTKQKPIFYSLKNQSKKTTNPYIIINQKDFKNIPGIINYILKNSLHDDDAEKINKIFEFFSEYQTHYPPPIKGLNFYTRYHYLSNPVQFLNSWEYGYCSEASEAFSSITQHMEFRSRIINILDKHVMSEVYYQNSWHLYDVDRIQTYKNQDETIASYAQILANPSLLAQTKNTANTKKGYLGNLISLQYEDFNKMNTSLIQEIEFPKKISFEYELNPHDEIIFYYDWKKKIFKKEPNQLINPPFSNGLLITTITPYQQAVQQLTKSPIHIKIQYPLVEQYIVSKNCTLDKISVLTDIQNYQEYNNVPCENGIHNISKFIEHDLPSNHVFIKIPKLIPNLTIISIFQLAPKSLPEFNAANIIENKSNSELLLTVGY